MFNMPPVIQWRWRKPRKIYPRVCFCRGGVLFKGGELSSVLYCNLLPVVKRTITGAVSILSK